MGLTYTFRSSDAGASTLENTAGSLLTVLDAILVDGYNSKTVTITRSGTTATVNCTSHGFRNGQILAISGANESDYNITARCTYVDANNVTYQVANSPTTPATGTITAKVAPLGWTKAYTGTNKTAYRQPTSGANGFYMRVDDTGTTDAQFRGYETMSDVDTGTGLFPTTSQMALGSGAYLYKASGTGRPWRAFSDGKLLYLFTQPTATSWGANNVSSMVFGDFQSNVAADTYNTVCCGHSGASSTGASSSHHFSYVQNYDAPGNANKHYIARPYSQSGTALDAPKSIANWSWGANSSLYGNSAAGFGGIGPAYPDVVVGGAVLTRPFLIEQRSRRGTLQGVWAWCHNSGGAIGDTFSGQSGGELEGKTFEMIFCASGSGYQYGVWCMETSDDW